MEKACGLWILDLCALIVLVTLRCRIISTRAQLAVSSTFSRFVLFDVKITKDSCAEVQMISCFLIQTHVALKMFCLLYNLSGRLLVSLLSLVEVLELCVKV